MSNTKITWKLQDYVAHAGAVKCLALGHNTGRVMVTGGNDMKVNMWALSKPNCLMSLSGHSSPIEAVRFNNSEQRVASGGSSGVLKIWDLEAAKIMRNLTNHKGAVRCIEFYAHNDFIASGSADNNVKLWDLRRKACINTYKGHASPINCVRFSPDGRWVASADDSGVVKIWLLSEGRQLCELNRHSGPIRGMEFHPTDFVLATGSADRTIKFWDLDKLDLISDGRSSAVGNILFHPDGVCLYSSSQGAIDVFGWDPWVHHYSQVVQCGCAADMTIVQNQLVGAAFADTKVTTFVVDIQRIPPLAEDMTRCVSSSGGRKMFVSGTPPDEPAKKPEKSKRRSPLDDGDAAGDIDIKDPEFLRKGFKLPVEPFRAPEGDVGPSSYDGVYRSPPADDYRANRNGSVDAHGGRSHIDAIAQINKGHDTVMSVLSSRNRNIRLVKMKMNADGLKCGLEVALSMHDHAVLHDVLCSLMCTRPSPWTLDLCAMVLPQLEEMVNSKHENHIHISLSTLRLLVGTFGAVIKTNVQSPPPESPVDFARQDRYYKCKSCYDILSLIRGDLDDASSKYHGRLGVKVREIALMIRQM